MPWALFELLPDGIERYVSTYVDYSSAVRARERREAMLRRVRTTVPEHRIRAVGY
jgi:hypothetical protein